MSAEFPGTAGFAAGVGPGSRVAGYVLEEQVGAGGMAVVFRATDERLGRQVAVKVLAPALAADQGFRLRFLRESRAAAAVDDPHIIPVYEAGEASGVFFIAMRFVPGRDVRTLLVEHGPLPPSRVAAIISPVASALGAAHAATPAASTSAAGTWASATSAAAGGGMKTLIAAAQREGVLNVIALPADWANYGNIIKEFTKLCGIRVDSSNPNGSSQDEINAVIQANGTATGPDVLDIGTSFATANSSLFAPYTVKTWSAIPAAQKDANGLWYEDYGGYMSVGYNSAKFGTITSLNQLLGPRFKNTVALNGNPVAANAALNGVMMVNLAEGGTAENITTGVSFFHKLKQAGNFSPIQVTSASVQSGQTEVVLNWDYLNTASAVGSPTWKVFVPSNAVLGGYYAQAISKNAPHPAAARLWEEYLYSQAANGGQNQWLEGGAHPVEQRAMTDNGTINATAAAALPPVSGNPVFLTQTQTNNAASYLAAHWAHAVS